MKFKLKIPNSGINDVFITLQNENLSFGCLKEVVASVLDENFTQKGTPFKLSLNGKDELVAENDSSLTTDLGLVHGDIIRVLIENKYLDEQRAINLQMAREAEQAAERSQTVNGTCVGLCCAASPHRNRSPNYYDTNTKLQMWKPVTMP
jgi:hypothetical protein